MMRDTYMEVLPPMDDNYALRANWFSAPPRVWTTEENKLFERALACFLDLRCPDWEKVAQAIPGRTVLEIVQHYKSLETDVCHIEGKHSFFHEATGNKGSNQINNDENTIDFDSMLQDPCATPVPVPLTLDFLKDITNNFSEEQVLGRGGFGVVYKGVLKNGMEIAVKKMKILEMNLNDEQYKRELRNLIGLEHKNVVQLKGYCIHSCEVLWPESQSQRTDHCMQLVEERERLLCFEYISNGNLRQQISDASRGLEWPVRYEIIKGICSGLHYIHTQRDIAHMDIKPENILLDDNMVPKIGDFGTSRLFDENQSRITTKNSVGSRGYMAPEYQNRGIISKKADIFSFGVIVLELVTGSKSDYPERKKLFPQFTEDVVQKWRNRLPSADYCRQVRTCISIALNCVDANRDRRPTIGCIIKKLDKVQNLVSSSHERNRRRRRDDSR